MNFLWCTISVKDMAESLDFYQNVVGLTIQNRFAAGPDMEIVFLGEDETKVELIHNRKQEKVDLGKDISLGFQVKSLEEKMEFIKQKGIPIHSGPFEPGPNARFFFVLDPNGLKIQFVENR